MDLIPHRKLRTLIVSHVMLGVLMGTICPPAEAAKRKPKEAPPLLIEEQPKFDTSFSLSPFQLGIKKVELRAASRKALLHAQDSLGLLHGGAHEFRLQTATNNVSLQAQNARADRSLQGGVDKNGRPLQGRVDKNGRPLQGNVAETPLSPLNTHERGVRAPFQFDLKKLTAEIAPDIFTQMDAELGEARTRAEDARREAKQLEPQLNARTPHPDIPPTPVKANLGDALSRSIDSELAESKKHAQDSTKRGTQQLSMEMGRGQMMNGAMPRLPGMKIAMVPKAPLLGGKDDKTTKKSQQQMTTELGHASKPVTSTDLNSKIDNAKNQAQNDVATVQPGLNAILTHARALPAAKLPANPNANGQGDAIDVVPWDEWHARFARLARRPILTNVSKAKTTSGSDTVEVTVWRNHRVSAKVTKGSNEAFDRAVVNAYNSLSGSAALEFPKKSKRASITFLVDNEHKGAGIPSAVQSKPSVGDKELIRYHF